MNIKQASTHQGSQQRSTGSSSSSDISDRFMAMLTASLMHQDPTKPLDTYQMSSQLSQIAGVEQQEKTNQNLGFLAGIVGNVGNMVSMGIVGSTATVAVADFEWDATAEGGVNGSILVDDAKLDYKYKIDVMDESGNIVDTIEPKLENGKLVYSWDGNKSDGEKCPSGKYSFEVNYLDTDGNKIKDADAVITATSSIKTMNYWPHSSTVLSNGMKINDAAIIAIEKS